MQANAKQSETWEVLLDVDGAYVRKTVTIEPPFGIRCADAEVKAIKAALALGATHVRAIRSSYVDDLK